MAKRRKRKNPDIPAKGRLKDIADRLWSLAVRDDWANKCAVCGTGSELNAHHLISRQHQTTRYDLRNGICLCARHHKWCGDMSPHENAEGFRQWMEKNHPLRRQWWSETIATQAYKHFDGITDEPYYCGIIEGFREYFEPEAFERIVGVKFAAWLEENEGYQCLKKHFLLT